MNNLFNIATLAVFVFLFLLVSACGAGKTNSESPNILMIIVDDWKPLAAVYGDSIIQTPSIDALAREGTIFHRSYAQHPVCGPSRVSMLTGLRPSAHGVLDLKTKMRDVHPNILTMPQLFKRAGYVTAAAGKVFDPRTVDSRLLSDSRSWSIPYKPPHGIERARSGPNYVMESIDAPIDDFIDGNILNGGVRLLKRLSRGDSPFFLAVGFKRPHLPFFVPKSFYDRFETADFPMDIVQHAPSDSELALRGKNNTELRNYWPAAESKTPASAYDEVISEQQQRALKRGYYASVSFIDHLIGELLRTLAKTAAAENTIVVLWGDSGFYLGDHGTWGKHALMEQAVRVPLIMKGPGIKQQATSSIVESIDLFPTLVELAGLSTPPHLNGSSLVDTLKGRDLGAQDVAISELRWDMGSGYSLRTSRHRYTEWIKGDSVVLQELYDLQADEVERLNIAGAVDSQKLLDSLAKELRKHQPELSRVRPFPE